jgi:hypothetical protein
LDGYNEQTVKGNRRIGSRRLARRWIAGLSLIGLGLACSAGCQSRLDEAYGIRTAALTDMRAHLDFVARHRERDQRSKVTGTKTESEETIFEETLSLKTEGFLLHPNLFEFGLGAVFGLTQEEFSEVIDEFERSDSNTGDILEFDVNALIFKRRKTPMTVYAHRRRGLLPRPFLPSLENTTESYGFTWQYLDEKTPTTMQFNHTDTDLNSLFVSGAADESGSERNTTFTFETAYVFNDHNVLEFEYEHLVVSEQPGNLDYDADEITLTHRLEFGDRKQHELRSELYALDQRGTIDWEEIRWREDLWLQHTDTLDTRWEFEAYDRDRTFRAADLSRIDEESIYFSGMVRHQLFESQITQLRMFYRKQKFKPDLDQTLWGGQAIINYRKRNPWGLFRANYAFRAEQNDNKGESQFAEVIDERQTFRDPEPVVLNNRNVVTGSVTITALDDVTFYARGRDYTQQTVGNTVELLRIPSGRIANGETVLIDYLFESGGTFKIETIRHNVDVAQEFDFGLTPYYRFERQDQTLDPADATGAIAEDITAHTVGVEYRRSSLRLFAEYEDNDSNVNPFHATRTGLSYTHRFKNGALSSVNANWTESQNQAPVNRDIRLFTIEGRHRHPITPNLTLEGAVLYRNGDDSITGDSEGVDFSFSLEWLIRSTEVRISLEHNDYDDNFTENESTALLVHIRRQLW